MWIQLLAPRQFTVAGKQKRFEIGDWVDVGEQSARRMIADNLARASDPVMLLSDLAGAGIVAYGDDDEHVAARAKEMRMLLPGVPIQESIDPKLSFARTLLWNVEVSFRPELAAVGFAQLRTWECAAVVWSYDDLASKQGTVEERAETASVIRDLRALVYDSRFVFLKRCRVGIDLLRTWKGERDGDDKLALLRSLYQIKPLLCPLPPTWLREAA